MEQTFPVQWISWKSDKCGKGCKKPPERGIYSPAMASFRSNFCRHNPRSSRPQHKSTSIENKGLGGSSLPGPRRNEQRKDWEKGGRERSTNQSVRSKQMRKGPLSSPTLYCAGKSLLSMRSASQKGCCRRRYFYLIGSANITNETRFSTKGCHYKWYYHFHLSQELSRARSWSVCTCMLM